MKGSLTLSYERLTATITYQDAALGHGVLILVTANDFLFFKDFESVALPSVFLLDEEDFAVGALADELSYL